MPELNFNNLEKAILKTLAFFDVFDYPLTLIEVHKWLYQPGAFYSLMEVVTVLNSEQLKSKISQKKGFYFLKSRDHIVDIRLSRYQIAEKKFKIALKATRFLRWISFVKMIAVCNNVGYNNGSKDSDIDFFIVVRQGRLWWSRLLITITTTLLGVRRHGYKVVDRVCLSFYTADSHLDLSDISLKPVDPYLIYWFATLAPIYDRGIYQKFLGANSWLKEYLPNFYNTQLNDRRSVKDKKYIKVWRSIDKFVLKGSFGNLLEKISRTVELQKIKSYFGNSLAQTNTNVIMSETMLKLHKIDRREKYKNMWQEKLTKLEI